MNAANRPRPSTASGPVLHIDGLLDDPGTRVIVCCGSGGVGKTTSAAALALRAAERGRRVAVMTIDPARRLAQSLGLDELDNTPRAVAGLGAEEQAGFGSLDAMMLDMKRTFDEVVQAHATPEKAEQILANPFYVALSSSFAGTQEYMAMEKLGQLHAQRGRDGRPRWDLIVVDTPPSRSALDFLDAPERLGSFLDGRFIRLLLAPAKVGSRAYLKVVSKGMGVARGALSKVLGTQLLDDVQTLVAALDTMFGGFRERADQTYALLQQPGTAFVVVASPERDALREAGYFVERLQADSMPLAGVVVNRMVRTLAPDLDATEAERVAERLLAEPGDGQFDETSATGLLPGMLSLQAETARTAVRHEESARRFADRHPGVAMVHVPLAAVDVHDLEGLRDIGAALAGTSVGAGPAGQAG
ncbi:ArsA family ATPase [Piscicoccus intestinalis]|uniref:ArsA family ATPase n=1 Tax=Piscicoccus intestinalis TaxID=746033 RepID=UPI0008386F65|nr:ArsA family ATPase [Piscicoccus intestinalis]